MTTNMSGEDVAKLLSREMLIDRARNSVTSARQAMEDSFQAARQIASLDAMRGDEADGNLFASRVRSLDKLRAGLLEMYTEIGKFIINMDEEGARR